MGTEKKKKVFMTSSPISVNRVDAISKEGKIPDFTYSCSKLQLEKPRFTAVSARCASVTDGLTP